MRSVGTLDKETAVPQSGRVTHRDLKAGGWHCSWLAVCGIIRALNLLAGRDVMQMQRHGQALDAVLEPQARDALVCFCVWKEHVRLQHGAGRVGMVWKDSWRSAGGLRANGMDSAARHLALGLPLPVTLRLGKGGVVVCAFPRYDSYLLVIGYFRDSVPAESLGRKVPTHLTHRMNWHAHHTQVNNTSARHCT